MSSEEEVYEVECIRKKRICPDGGIMYYIKWLNYEEKDNTWEPIEHLDCKDLIAEFENSPDKEVEDLTSKSQASKKKSSSKQSTNSTSNRRSNHNNNKFTKNNGLLSSQTQTGFDEGLTVEQILGATDAAGELMFLIKWKERNEASLISAKIANAKCPQQVIQYLSSKITFTSDN